MHTTIASKPEELVCRNLYLKIQDVIPNDIFVKVEGLNVAGSIKLKPAIYMIDKLEEEGVITKSSHIIESSSGNLGVALAYVCANRGYQFTCVTDPNASSRSIKHMESLGANIVMITQKDKNGGYLGNRIKHIKQLLNTNRSYVWPNQYKNDNNWRAHEKTTAQELFKSFMKIDWLFIGVGTMGTLRGVKSFFSKHSPKTRIVGVDTVGSVTFGYPPSKRLIPGLGTSRRPEIFVDNEHVLIPEKDAIHMCQRFAKKGFLFGGSTGSVLSGIVKYYEHMSPNDTIVAISPDLGEKYLDTIYNETWLVENNFYSEDKYVYLEYAS